MNASSTAPEAAPRRLKVTVIMPGRNEGARIESTVASILAGTRPPDEIVVADADSSDDTAERVAALARRGVPIRLVRNPSLFAGGGRNCATRAAQHEIIVNMDFGNRADPRWLESLVRPFEEDPDLDLVGGIYYPILETSFQRVSGAVIYFEDCLLPTMDRAAIEPLIPPQFVPGGMCMAYRRRAWERAGGFSEWARKGQDLLFGHRIRRIGGKVGYTLDAIVHHHMASSFGDLWHRHFLYELWSARTALPRPQFRRLLLTYLAGAALAPGAVAVSAWLAVLGALGVLGYAYAGAWRKLRAVARVTGRGFRASEYLLAAAVLLVRDAAVLAGTARGTVERLLVPEWRRRTRAYLEEGR